MWTKCNFLFTVLRDNFPFQSKVHQTSSDQPGKNKKILYSEKDAPLIIPVKATEFTVLYHIIHLVQLF